DADQVGWPSAAAAGPRHRAGRGLLRTLVDGDETALHEVGQRVADRRAARVKVGGELGARRRPAAPVQRGQQPRGVVRRVVARRTADRSGQIGGHSTIMYLYNVCTK